MNLGDAGDVVWSERYVYRGQDDADYSGVQSFWARIDTEDAKSEIWVRARCEQ